MTDDRTTTREDESDDERLTRNLNELLQELRVTQTGVQILTGFLLTVPFSQRFTELDDRQTIGYLAVLAGAVVATGFIVTPVALHRALFRQGERVWLVAMANRCAAAGLAVLALTVSGVVWLVTDIVLDPLAGIVAGLVTLVFRGTLWAVLPVVRRSRGVTRS